MSGTVLIVDGDANARIIAETLLRLRGLSVRSTGDGGEANDIMHREDVAVVVWDLGVAGINELGQARQRRIETSSETRVIAVTNRKEPEVERFAQRLGADALLRKPLQPAQLISTVEQLLPSDVPPSGAVLSVPWR